MQLGMVGLGRMGANMVRRLMRGGHECVVYDRSADAVKELEGEGAIGATSLDDFISKLNAPKAIWLMLPAAVVDMSLKDLSGRLSAGDIVIDGGNSYYIDDIRRAKELAEKGIQYVDVGTSGVLWLARTRGASARAQQVHESGQARKTYVSTRFSRRSRPDAARLSARPDGKKWGGHPKTGICTVVPTGRGILSKWCTTALNMASWRLMPRG